MIKLNEPKKNYSSTELLFTDFRIQDINNSCSEIKPCKNKHPCFVSSSFGGNEETHLYCPECGTEIMRLSKFSITYKEL